MVCSFKSVQPPVYSNIMVPSSIIFSYPSIHGLVLELELLALLIGAVADHLNQCLLIRTWMDTVCVCVCVQHNDMSEDTRTCMLNDIIMYVHV